MDSRWKGQLVGDILAVLKQSMFGPTGIFGLIVQATEVSKYVNMEKGRIEPELFGLQLYICHCSTKREEKAT